MRAAIIVRPQPGADATVERLRAAGVPATAIPLFAAGPLMWEPPAAGAHDALLLTSANAVRHAGPALSAFATLPAWCVGEATAAAARAAGLSVARVGDADAVALMATPEAAGLRWLWLAGARHQSLTAPPGATMTVRTVYASEPLPPPEALRDALARPAVLLIHSAAAAEHLRALVADRSLHRLAALSDRVAAAAGEGWEQVAVAVRPDDAEMVAIAARLCQNAAHE